MVSRETLDARGVFTSDMEEIHTRLDEVHCILGMVAQRVKADFPEIAIVLNSAARSQREITHDLGNIEDVLRERGVILTPEEGMAAKRRAAELTVTPEEVLTTSRELRACGAIKRIAAKAVRRSRKAARR